MNEYEAKQEAKRERLERAAARAQEEAGRAFDRAHAATEGIPFGQPILVGHHSEKRHRGALARADRAGRKGCELMEKSRELASRAEAVGTGGISSDDPDAIGKLDEKRTDLEVRRDNMKKANAYFKAHKTLEGCDVPAEIIAEGLSNMKAWGSVYASPFPPYALTNIGARIRDAQKRATRIEKVAAIPAGEERVGVATITTDPADNRVSISFPDRLSRDDYKRVRSAGFVWSPTRNAFTRKLGNNAIWQARQLAERLPTVGTSAQEPTNG